MSQKNSFRGLEKFFSFTKKFILALLCCVFCRALTNRDNYYLFFIAIIIFAIPLTKYACYKTTIRKKYKLQDYKTEKSIPFWVKIRWPIYLVNLIWYTLLSFFTVVYVTTVSKNEAIALGIIIVGLIIIHSFIGLITKNRFKESRREYRLFGWKKWGSIIIGTIAYPIVLFLLGGINDSSTSIFSVNKIAYVIEGIFNGINTFSYAILNNDLSKELNSSFYYAAVVFILQGGFLFFCLTNYFLSWFITKDQKKQIISPVELTELTEKPSKNKKDSTEDDSVAKENLTPGLEKALAKLEQAKVKKVKREKRKLFFKQIGVFLIEVIFILLIFLGVYKICNHKDLSTYVVDKTTLVTEVIEGEIYRLGTSAKYALLGEEFSADTKQELEEAVNLYFDTMVLNTEDYLDWYYSLAREYSELLTYVGGVVENQLEEKAEAFLAKNFDEKILPEYEISDQLDSIFEQNLLDFNNAKKILFDENRIRNPNKMYYLNVKTSGLDIISKTGKPSALMSGKAKFLVAAGGGTVAGVAVSITTKKLLTKLSTKLTQKAATKAITAAVSTATKKSVSSVVSGALGSFVGSLAGPVGTVIGAVVGIAATLGIDYLILEIDEAVNREDYRNDIISCIEEERQFYLTLVNNQMQEIMN